METPLETAVRAYFKAKFEPLLGRNPRFTPEVIEQVIEKQTQELLPLLRRHLSDDDIPTEGDLQRAEMDASLGSIKRMVGIMSAPKTLARLVAQPRRLAIVSTLAKNAAIDLAALRTLRNDPTEEKLKAVTQGIVGRMERFTEKVKSTDR